MDGAGSGIFPRHRADLLAMSEAQLDALEVFYSTKFYGSYLQMRRISFGDYIGVCLF